MSFAYHLFREGSTPFAISTIAKKDQCMETNWRFQRLSESVRYKIFRAQPRGGDSSRAGRFRHAAVEDQAGRAYRDRVL